MKSQALLIPFLFISSVCFSQYFQNYTDEALLYSRTGLFGTARSVGAGGAFGSVGADLGSLNINPAGIGLYRSGDFSVTPGLRIGNNMANYDGGNTSAQLATAFLSQMGIEWTWALKNSSTNNNKEMGFTTHSSQLRSVSLAINYQHDNLYARRQNFNAYNNSNSMMDNFVNYYANSQPLEMYMAQNVGLITGTAPNLVSNVKLPVYQMGSVETRGGIDAINLTFGGNINDKLYFGVSLGVPILSLNNSPSFTETSTDPTSNFIGYNISTTQSVTGEGITGSLGLIYRPVEWLRLGAAYHLPTWYSLNESYNSSIYASFDTTSFSPTDQEGYQPFHYGFSTPMKGVLSASFYLKQYGFFSVDYEIQNYGSDRFYPGDGTIPASDINDSIKAWYGYSHTIRAGFEGAYKLLRIRAGYAISTSPVRPDSYIAVSGYNQLQQNITAGIGVRFKRFYVDFAYVYGFMKDASFPLATDGFTSKYSSSTMLLTLGWKMQPRQSKRSTAPVNNNNYHDYRDGY